MVHDILETEAILISNPNSPHQLIVDMLQRRIEGYITATKYVLLIYNVSAELLAKSIEITPGKRSPTITNLESGDKSVSSLVNKKEVPQKMDALSALGATDILTLSLDNSRM